MHMKKAYTHFYIYARMCITSRPTPMYVLSRRLVNKKLGHRDGSQATLHELHPSNHVAFCLHGLIVEAQVHHCCL